MLGSWVERERDARLQVIVLKFIARISRFSPSSSASSVLVVIAAHSFLSHQGTTGASPEFFVSRGRFPARSSARRPALGPDGSRAERSRGAGEQARSTQVSQLSGCRY